MIIRCTSIVMQWQFTPTTHVQFYMITTENTPNRALFNWPIVKDTDNTNSEPIKTQSNYM